jgi:hypothetical protein
MSVSPTPQLETTAQLNATISDMLILLLTEQIPVSERLTLNWKNCWRLCSQIRILLTLILIQKRMGT